MVEEFKNTDYGVIPNDWNSVPLGDVCLKVQDGNYGESYPKSNEFVKIGVPFLTSKAIGKNGVLKDHLIDFITEKKHSVLAKAHLSLHDVLFTNRGASVGAIGFVNERIANGNIGPQLTLLRANKACLEPLYLFQVMKSKFVQKQILGQDSGSAMNFFGIGSTKKFQIPLPPSKAEQTAIATALNDADALITRLEKLIAKKRNIKQGAMQELLKPKEGWEMKKLGEILKSVQLGGNYPNSEKSTAFPLIKMGNIQRGYISTKKIEYIIENYKPEKKDRLKYGDVLFNTRNTLELVGKVSVWRNELPEAYFNSNLMRMEFNPELISSNFFMNYIFNTKYSIARLKDIATGTTSVAAIYTRDLVNIEIHLPKPKEQTRIAQILSDMDAEIEALDKKLEKYKMIKQGMMQNLLTGRVRLV